MVETRPRGMGRHDINTENAISSAGKLTPPEMEKGKKDNDKSTYANHD